MNKHLQVYHISYHCTVIYIYGYDRVYYFKRVQLQYLVPMLGVITSNIDANALSALCPRPSVMFAHKLQQWGLDR